MKKSIILLSLIAGGFFSLHAQQSFNVVQGNVYYNFPTSEVGVMNFTAGNTLTILGNAYNLDQVDRMCVLPLEISNNEVVVEYKGTEAEVYVAYNIAPYITADIKGAHVSLTQSKEVGDATGEITYILKGESDNGSFTFDGSYKSTIELQGLTLTNPTGAAIDIENGKRIELSAKNGYVNTLVDGAGGSQKAALYCKGHLELKGKGTLNVTGNTSHAISAKEYIEMKNCTLNILGSVKDGINCNQYFLLESGELTITNPGDDGIQVSFADAKNPDEEDTGTITIAGGKLSIDAITAAACKGLKAEGNFVMTGGDVTVVSNAPGEWDSSKSKTKASSCIGIDQNVTISGGTLDLKATGGGGKGISCDDIFTFKDGTLKILTSGGVLAYVNGALNQSYTGNTDRLDGDYKSSPKGVKADGGVEIYNGNIDITTSGNGGEGIESKAELTIYDGNIKVRSKDDCINSSSHMYIKGGVIEVISTGNDGLDSNGNLYIEGGLVMAFGAGAPECGLDANEEEGYTVYFTGGYILAAGGNNSYPRKEGSTQPFVTANLAVNANTEVSIGTGSETLYTFTTPSDLTSVNLGGSSRPGGPGGMGGNNSSALLISVPGLVSGTNYTVKSGTNSASASAKLTGSSSGGRW